jgi:hypothetical protein
MSKGPPFEIRDLPTNGCFPSHLQVPRLPLSYPAAHSFRKAAQPRRSPTNCGVSPKVQGWEENDENVEISIDFTEK